VSWHDVTYTAVMAQVHFHSFNEPCNADCNTYMNGTRRPLTEDERRRCEDDRASLISEPERAEFMLRVERARKGRS